MEHEARRLGTSRILLIDQNAEAAALVTEMLRGAGPERRVLARAERLEDAGQELLDYGASCAVLAMTAVVGLGPLEQLRTIAPEVPIVVVSELADEAYALQAIRAGAQDYLVRGELNATLLRRAITHAIERNRSEVQLAERALHDPLTGLPNRALFLDRLSVALDRLRRTRATVAVLFLDIDDFKRVNDSLGHAAGDRVLHQLARRLRGMLRPMDTVARFGGDEFTFLFEELASEREAMLIAERISRTAELPVALADAETRVAVSIGITLVSDPATAPETVIREADAAMYRAKEPGTPRYELFDEGLRQRAHARIEREAALRKAVEGSELRVVYEPRVSLGPGARIVGFEALLRWEHPERGPMGSEEFMPLAEETGLALTIRQYLLSEALGTRERWRARDREVAVSVSASARELEDPGLASALERSRAAGLVLALASFGADGSSVDDLAGLPVDLFKLDRSFVEPLGHHAQHPPVLEAMVALGHALKRTVVAAGVATEARLGQLRAVGCDAAQGPLFGTPVSDEDALLLLGDQ